MRFSPSSFLFSFSSFLQISPDTILANPFPKSNTFFTGFTKKIYFRHLHQKNSRSGCKTCRRSNFFLLL